MCDCDFNTGMCPIRSLDNNNSNGGAGAGGAVSRQFTLVRAAARSSSILFLAQVFGGTVTEAQARGELRDLEVDLVRLFSDYAREITSSSYDRLADAIVLNDMTDDVANDKLEFGPAEGGYYTRKFASDDEEEEEDGSSDDDDDAPCVECGYSKEDHDANDGNCVEEEKEEEK
jgi:hypothetical protein